MGSKKWSKLNALKVRLTKSVSRNTKKVIFSVGASLLIGLLFGLISLQMASKEGSKAESSEVSTNIANTTNQATEEEFGAASFYVVQAGIFQESDNAKKRSARFEEAGFSTMEWRRDEQIYLIAAIGASKEACNEVAAKMKKANLEVFVKKWDVQSHTLAVTDADEQYLKNFLEKWQQSLEKEEIQSLSSLVAEDRDLSEAVQPLKIELDVLSKEEGISNQMYLLKAIETYEKLFNN